MVDSHCPSNEFLCHNGEQCIPIAWVCDNAEDCVDGSDEGSCGGKKHATIQKHFDATMMLLSEGYLP